MEQEQIHPVAEDAGETKPFFTKNNFKPQPGFLSVNSFRNYFLERFFFLTEQKTGFSKERLQSQVRERSLAYRRHYLSKILYENTDLSLLEIGKILNKDHATILYNLKPKNSKRFTEKDLEDYNTLYELFISLIEEMLSDAALFAWCEIKGIKSSPFVCKLNVSRHLLATPRPEDKEISNAKQAAARAQKEIKRQAEAGKRAERLEFFMKDYASGITIEELAKKHNIGPDRVRQILRGDREMYIQAKKENEQKEKINKERKKQERLREFIELVKKTGRVPGMEEAVSQMVIPKAFHYEWLKCEALKLGYESKHKLEKEERDAEKRVKKIEYLKELAARLGYTPGMRELNAEGIHWGSSYDYYFGSLSKAQELAGLKPNTVGNSHERSARIGEFISQQQCIEELKNLQQQLGHKPSWKEVKEYGSHTCDLYRERIGESIREYVHYYNRKKGISESSADEK